MITQKGYVIAVFCILVRSASNPHHRGQLRQRRIEAALRLGVAQEFDVLDQHFLRRR